jgi:hypothetical protein
MVGASLRCYRRQDHRHNRSSDQSPSKPHRHTFIIICLPAGLRSHSNEGPSPLSRINLTSRRPDMCNAAPSPRVSLAALPSAQHIGTGNFFGAIHRVREQSETGKYCRVALFIPQFYQNGSVSLSTRSHFRLDDCRRFCSCSCAVLLLTSRQSTSLENRRRVRSLASRQQ